MRSGLRGVTWWLARPLAVACALALPAASAEAQAQAPASADEALWHLYRAAVEDAAVVEPDEVRPLRPLFEAGASAATVVTWTSWPGYRKGERLTLPDDVWAVALPELQEAVSRFPSGMDEAAFRLRLEQLYGLPPRVGKSRFAFLSVTRAQADKCEVFRPTADPDTSRAWPGAGERGLGGVTAFPLRVPSAHVLWMASKMLGSYTAHDPACIGYPWTRLGYTYDWKPAAAEGGTPRALEHGLSEYVIRSGATVSVLDVQLTPDFFRAYAR